MPTSCNFKKLLYVRYAALSALQFHGRIANHSLTPCKKEGRRRFTWDRSANNRSNRLKKASAGFPCWEIKSLIYAGKK
ncbi:hypothetical protein SAY87_014161 [Trapa incisa]|uniref:Uncharacterized protein n=1 Tax=Trapa incisa TaxID=236973 RepID=A0AAN7GJN9_9MYRT|nr:hypothetical protein SAY87_014161 [Trapa incisa]